MIRKTIKKQNKKRCWNPNAMVSLTFPFLPSRFGFGTLFSCGAKEGVSVPWEGQVDATRAPIEGLREREASSVSEAVPSLDLKLKG